MSSFDCGGVGLAKEIATSILYDFKVAAEAILMALLVELDLAVLELRSALLRLNSRRVTTSWTNCSPDSPDLTD